MYINYYQSYLAMIRNSVGSWTRRNFYIDFDSGSSKDILRWWEESCAFYVSSILRLFNLSWATFANVLSLEKHLLSYGRSKAEDYSDPEKLLPGSIIIREKRAGKDKSDMFGNDRSYNYHIGFYIWNNEAISNYSDGFQDGKVIEKPLCPRKHHYTYNNERQIKSILTFPFFMNTIEYINHSHFHFLINQQLEIPFIWQTKSYLIQYGFNGDDLIRAIGEEDGLNLGRMCGWACIVMAYQYLIGKKDKTLKDILPFKDRSHEKWAYRTQQAWRYHDGLMAIAHEWWLSGVRWILKTEDISALRQLIANCIDNKKILILSVSPWFDISKKWWHLVVIRWYNRNGYNEELIINDPLDPKAEEGFSWAPIPKKLTDIVECWSGNYMIISRS